MNKLVLITLALVLAACTAAPNDPATPLQTWQDAGISHYRFNLHLSCFCVFIDQMPLTIEVKDGEVVSVIDAKGQTLASDDVNYEFFLQYGTIDRIFEKIESAQADPEAGDVIVTYDPSLGFPVDAAIDYIELAADDEIYLTISGFESLQ